MWYFAIAVPLCTHIKVDPRRLDRESRNPPTLPCNVVTGQLYNTCKACITHNELKLILSTRCANFSCHYTRGALAIKQWSWCNICSLCISFLMSFTQSGDHAAQGDQGFVDAGTFLQPCAWGGCSIRPLTACQVYQVDLTWGLTRQLCIKPRLSHSVMLMSISYEDYLGQNRQQVHRYLRIHLC